MKEDSELISMLYLMGDPDVVVRDAVRSRLVERGEKAVEYLENYVSRSVAGETGTEYIDFLSSVKCDIAKDKLALLLKEPEPVLYLGFLYISKVADPEVDEALFSQSLTSLAQEFSSELSDKKTAIENIEIFNYLFFKRYGFHHSDIRMTQPGQAMLDRVILSRGGNPVTVTLLYFLLAQAVGLPVYPLCFPGGFVPVYLEKNGNILFYLNIFKNGNIFFENTLKQFFDEIGIPYNQEELKVEQERALLSIYAELLAFVYKNAEVNEVADRIEEVIEMMGGRRYL
jgi:regulator of sirC expression with transglutaminase-like and TPR domain